MQRHIAELENVCTKKNDEMGDLRKTMDALNGQIKTAQRDSQDKDKVKKDAQQKSHDKDEEMMDVFNELLKTTHDPVGPLTDQGVAE